MGSIQAPLHVPPNRSRRRLKTALTVTVVLLTSALCLFFSPREYPGAYRAPDCVSPRVSIFHKRALVSLIITHCLLSRDPAPVVRDWYYTSSRLTPVDIPGYPYWGLGPLTVMVYFEVEMPAPDVVGGSPDSGETAVISRTHYGLGWRRWP